MKNLKKIISLLLVLAIMSNASFVFAESGNICRISNTPDYITDYIKNLRKVVSNVSKSAIEKRKDKSDNIFGESNNKSYNKVYGGLNSLFTWKGYSLNFEYSIGENTNEIPKQAKRDIKILEQEKDNLLKYYENFAKKDLSRVNINKNEVCEEVKNKDEVCEKYLNTEEESIDILLKSSRSINNLILYIKNNAVNKNVDGVNNYFLLKDENINSIKKDYSVESLEDCSKSESSENDKGFFKTIIDAIKKISLTGKKSNNKTNDWKEAIDILWGNNQDKKYIENERKLLRTELQKQGIGGDGASAIMGNLDAYNKNGKILGGEKGFLNSLNSQINEFEETLKATEKQMREDKAISAKDFNSKALSIKSTEEIKISINSLYGKLKELSLEDDNINETLVNRMIKMHLNLSEATNTLNKTCEISVKVCNSQKKGQGDCGSCY